MHTARWSAGSLASAQPASPQPTSPQVLLLQRLSKGRHLVGATTGRTSEIFSAMCAHGLSVTLASMDPLPLRQQVRHMAAASVVVAVHGAHLANMVWMEGGTGLVEITFRFGWCCRLTPPMPKHSCKQCLGYNKACYANLATALGLRYRYVDPVYISPNWHPYPVNPIDRKFVYVNASMLARVTSSLACGAST